MRFRVTHAETTRDADDRSTTQRIHGIHDQGTAHPPPQLLLTLSGADVLKNPRGATIDIQIADGIG